MTTAILVGDYVTQDRVDLFDAPRAMEYITDLTIGYPLARGRAKAGSREHCTS
ncbi:hypothetical protein [Kocuria arenosa]|uniref:hypothetical protein n=1 Tax=Kocuria arenosa TaxID=3071446 RepID=UPI0034D50D70